MHATSSGRHAIDPFTFITGLIVGAIISYLVTKRPGGLDDFGTPRKQPDSRTPPPLVTPQVTPERASASSTPPPAQTVSVAPVDTGTATSIDEKPATDLGDTAHEVPSAHPQEDGDNSILAGGFVGGSSSSVQSAQPPENAPPATVELTPITPPAPTSSTETASAEPAEPTSADDVDDSCEVAGSTAHANEPATDTATKRDFPHRRNVENRPGGRHDQGPMDQAIDSTVAVPTDLGRAAPAERDSPVPQLVTWLEDGTWLVGIDFSQDTRPVRITSLDELITAPKGNPIEVVVNPKALIRPLGSRLLFFRITRAHGFLAPAPSVGGNLVLVPTGSEIVHDVAGADSARLDNSPLDGFDAYEVFLVEGTTLDVRSGDSIEHLRSERGVPGFGLDGTILWPRVGRVCATYDAPPAVVASDWSEVAAVVLGEDGVGQGSWRTTLTPGGTPCIDLSEHLADLAGGWFFLRAYDASGTLMDSIEFQFMRGLHSIRNHDNGHPQLLHTGPTHISFDHHKAVSVEPAAVHAREVTRRERAHGDGSAFRVAVTPDTGAISFSVSSHHASIRIDVPCRQLWWCVSEQTPTLTDWAQAPVSLRRTDVNDALSERALWLRLPPRWRRDQVRVAAINGPGNTWPLEIAPTKRDSIVKLRNLGNATGPNRPVAFDLYLLPTDDAGFEPIHLGTVTVSAVCRFCGFEFLTVEEASEHVIHAHSEDIAREPGLERLQRLFPDRQIPRRILKCPYSGHDGCDGHYESSFYDGDGADDRIYNHVKDEHPNREHAFVVVHHLDEVRDEFLRGLPRMVECQLCAPHLGQPATFTLDENGELDLLKHLLERHRTALWTLS